MMNKYSGMFEVKCLIMLNILIKGFFNGLILI